MNDSYENIIEDLNDDIKKNRNVDKENYIRRMESLGKGKGSNHVRRTSRSNEFDYVDENFKRHDKKRYYDEELEKAYNKKREAIIEEKKAWEDLNDALEKFGEESEQYAIAKEKFDEAANSLSNVNHQIEEIKHRSKENSISTKISDITQKIGEMYNGIKRLTEPWAKADHAASQYAKTIGMTKAGMDKMRDSAIKNVVKGKIGIDFNMDMKDLLEAQTNYAKAVGRNVRLSSEDQINMAAMSVVGGGAGNELAALYENFGVSMTSTSEHVGKMFSDAAKAGISFEKYAENVKTNIKIAQNYTFRDGLKGLESMAKKATAIKLDMQAIASLAEKAGTVEGSIDVASKLQVLGGPFTSASDPLGMLNESLNDMESLQDRVANMIGGLGTFNKATGEVNVSSFDKTRIKRAADAMGISSDQLMESVNAQARRGEIEKQINSSVKAAGLNDDMKELIKNSGTFKDGKAGVSINGQFKSLDELTNDDYDELVKETQSESEDIKDIARNVRSLADIEEGAGKQKDANQAEMTGHISGWFKKLVNFVGQSNFILHAILTAQAIGAVSNFFGGKGGKSFGEFFKNIGIKNGGNVGSAANRIGGRFGQKISSIFGKKTGEKIVTSSTGKIFTVGADGVMRNSSGKVISGAAKKKVLESAEKKAAVKAGGKLAGGLAKGGGIGIVGAVGNIATDMAVESGKMKKGGGAHIAAKTASTALEGAGIGAMVGSIIPGIGTAIGTAVGAAIGGVVGAVKGVKARREVVVDEQLKQMGLERKGNYGARRLKQLDKALQTGEMSDSLRRKLIHEGDIELVNKINKIKEEKEAKGENKEGEENEEGKKITKVEKAVFRINKANIMIGGTSLGQAGIAPGIPMPLNPQSLIKPVLEKGPSSSFSSFDKARKKYEESKEDSSKPISVNINGTIKLEGLNGISSDITKELLNNPTFIKEITSIITKQMDINKHGNSVPQRQK